MKLEVALQIFQWASACYEGLRLAQSTSNKLTSQCQFDFPEAFLQQYVHMLHFAHASLCTCCTLHMVHLTYVTLVGIAWTMLGSVCFGHKYAAKFVRDMIFVTNIQSMYAYRII